MHSASFFSSFVSGCLAVATFYALSRWTSASLSPVWLWNYFYSLLFSFSSLFSGFLNLQVVRVFLCKLPLIQCNILIYSHDLYMYICASCRCQNIQFCFVSDFAKGPWPRIWMISMHVTCYQLSFFIIDHALKYRLSFHFVIMLFSTNCHSILYLYAIPHFVCCFFTISDYFWFFK